MKGWVSSSVVLILLLACCEPAPTTPAPAAPAATCTKALARHTTTEVAGTPASTPDIIGTVVPASQPSILETSTSPDGVWRAEVILYDCVQASEVEAYAYEELRLIRADSSAEKTIDSQLQACGGVGAYGLGGLLWSSNGRHLYYTPAREGMPDGLCGYWERPLIRVDLESGESEGLSLRPISPEGTMIAMSGANVLVLWSIDQGEMARIPVAIRDASIRGIAWSPDSQAFVYLQTESDCYPVGRSYLTQIELPGLEQNVLFESETPSFGGVAWEAPDRIRLFDHEDGSEWDFNLVTSKPSPRQ